MSGSRSAQGSLSQTPIAQVMAYIYRKEMSGTLVIRDGGGNEFRIVFLKGMPSYVEGKGLGHPVGEIVVEAGLLSSADLDRCIEEARQQKMLLGQHLLSSGVLDKRQLETAVRIQIRKRIKDIFAIFEGEYEFYREENLTNLVFDNMVQTNLLAILPESLRLAWSDEQLREKVETLRGHMFSIVDPETCRKSFGWDGAETAALAFLDGKIWTLEQIEATEGERMGPLRVVLYSLLLTGRLNFDAGKAIEEGEKRKEEDRKKKIQSMAEMMQGKLQQIETGTYFDVLEVDIDAGLNDIKDGYLRMLKEYHPDRVQPLGVPELTGGFGKISVKIKEAMEVLANPESREKYVQHIKGETQDSKEEEQIVRQVLTDEIAFQKAIVLLNKKNWREVIRLMEPIVGKGTDNGEYMAVYAWAKISLTAEHEAVTPYLALLRQAVGKSPRSERANFFFALASQREGKLTDYRNHIRATVEINPHNVEAKRHLHIIEMREGKEKKSFLPSLDTGGLSEKIKGILKRKL